MSSILNDVKHSLQIETDDHSFDQSIIMHVNATFVILNQLGVGEKLFFIEDETAEWDEFINDTNVNLVKQYMYAKVRVLFDPPATSFVLSSLEKNVEQLEWRLNVEFDKGVT